MKIRQWLSAPDPSTNYRKALKQRQANTGLWFIDSKGHAKWKTTPASFRWLYGIPGCGKTILSSAVIQDLLQSCAGDPGKIIVYFYFDFNDAQKQKSEFMLRSLISQLSEHCVKIPAALESLFAECKNGERQPSLDALLEAMPELIKQFPATYIILDALDECNNRGELLEVLESMAGWQLERLHMIVTSRKEQDIEDSLESFIDKQNVVCLQSALVNEDIREFVRHRLYVDKRFKRWHKNEELRQEIEETLMKKAHGMLVPLLYFRINLLKRKPNSLSD